MDNSRRFKGALSYYEHQMCGRAGLSAISCQELIQRALANRWFMTEWERSVLEEIEHFLCKGAIEAIDEGRFRRVVRQITYDFKQSNPRRLFQRPDRLATD